MTMVGLFFRKFKANACLAYYSWREVTHHYKSGFRKFKCWRLGEINVLYWETYIKFVLSSLCPWRIIDTFVITMHPVRDYLNCNWYEWIHLKCNNLDFGKWHYWLLWLFCSDLLKSTTCWMWAISSGEHECPLLRTFCYRMWTLYVRKRQYFCLWYPNNLEGRSLKVKIKKFLLASCHVGV